MEADITEEFHRLTKESEKAGASRGLFRVCPQSQNLALRKDYKGQKKQPYEGRLLDFR